MDNIIDHTGSNNLITALEFNMAAFWSVYGRGDGGFYQSTAHIVQFYSGVNNALFNGVVYAKLKTNEIKATVEYLQSMINAQGSPAIWWLGPSSEPENLGSLLETYGLHSAGESPGMAVDLDEINNMPEKIEGFVIQKVSNKKMQDLWARTAAIGSDFPNSADELAKLEITLNNPQYKAQHRYIGFLNGSPVSTSAMVLDSGVAGIYAVSTLPIARRKGIGARMTIDPLEEARQRGYRVGILQSSTMGYSLYKRIGFKEICTFNLFYQSKKEK